MRMRWNKFKVECGQGCVNYSEVPRLELPEVRADEEVVTYGIFRHLHIH